MNSISAPAADTSASIDAHDTYARIFFGDGEHADFHWIWLRHQCPLERHPTTHERTLSPADVPSGVRAETALLKDDVLVIRWRGVGTDRPPSRYPLSWLREHTYSRGRIAPQTGAALAQVEVALDAHGQLPHDWHARVSRHGVVVGRSGQRNEAGPADTERLIEQLEGDGLRVIGTHFGRIEDLRTDNSTNENTDHGYTDAAIDLHTDQPFLETPPRYQLLHAIRAADAGGESLLADADAAARWLAANDAEAYAIHGRTSFRGARWVRGVYFDPVAGPGPDTAPRGRP